MKNSMHEMETQWKVSLINSTKQKREIEYGGHG